MNKLLTIATALSLIATPASACEYSKAAFEREKKIYYGVTALDAATTIYGVQHGARELNPLFGSRPSAERVIGQTIAMDVLYTLAINNLFKHDVCTAKTVQRVSLVIRGGIVGANLRLIF